MVYFATASVWNALYRTPGQGDDVKKKSAYSKALLWSWIFFGVMTGHVNELPTYPGGIKSFVVLAFFWR